jgi:DNA invertase Pin-like site-specific DNA recombinase
MTDIIKIPKKTVTVIQPQRSMIVDKEKHRQKRVAAYCRVSTDSDEQLTSYKNQMKVYTEMIAQNKEWSFAGLYADEGISGTRADKRPEFTKMINDCYAGKIDMIITKSVSRFARNTVECLNYVRLLKERSIGIYFEEQNIDTLKSDSELYLVIYAGFAQSESESMSKNITWTYRKKFEEGKPVFMYKKWLGYKKGEDGNPEIIPEEAAIVERIYDLYLSGETTRTISALLRAENIQVPNKSISFSRTMIVNILTNERYSGDCILQKTVTVDCIGKVRKKNTGEAPMYYVHNSHPAIISREKFNKVQEELVRRKNIAPQFTHQSLTASGKYSRNALTDVMICGECGSRYKRCTWSRKGVKRIVWRCASRLEHGTRYCNSSPSIHEEKLKDAIVRALHQFNSEDAVTYLSLMKATIGEALGLDGRSEEIDLLQRRIEALNSKMMNLVNTSVNNSSTVDDYEDEFKEIADEITQLKNRISVLRESIVNDESVEERLDKIQIALDKRAKCQNEYDETIVRQMIECIKVYHDKRIEIIFGGGYSITINIE